MTERLDLPADIAQMLQAAPFETLPDLWWDIEQAYGDPGKAWLGRVDRYYLLVRLLHRKDAIHPWLHARCREVEAETDGCLDLWAREHYKSTVITFAGIIQELIRDPEITIGIFSFNKPTARKFLVQIKTELETNEDLPRVYPDIFWANPKKEAIKWSEEKGIQVKRQSNAKEASVEGHGLVDGMPTGAHFRLRVYDDVVTKESVNTPDQVHKTTEAWELSDNLGAAGPDGLGRAWHVGTRYSFADTYQEILDRKALKPRIYAATDTGLPDGNPVLLSREAWEAKKLSQGPATLACQMLQNPAAGKQAMFSKDWLSFMDVRPATLNVYIMVDPAHSRKKDSDNTAIAVVGVDPSNQYWLLDGYRHKMGLMQRWNALRGMRRKWMRMPGVQSVSCGYERYGMQADLEFFELEMQKDRDAFEITELNWVSEGGQSKDDRVQRLQPAFMQKKFHLAAVCVGKDGKPYETRNQLAAREAGEAYRIFKPVFQKDEDGNLYSLNKGFLDEFLTYPFSAKKDLIDAVSRVFDMSPVAPILIDQSALEPEAFVDGT
jgi:hypothetical protein